MRRPSRAERNLQFAVSAVSLLYDPRTDPDQPEISSAQPPCLSVSTRNIMSNDVPSNAPARTYGHSDGARPQQKQQQQIPNESPVVLSADCPGTSSEEAGKSSACQGCPNQAVCASAPKGPDPGVSAVPQHSMHAWSHCLSNTGRHPQHPFLNLSHMHAASL